MKENFSHINDDLLVKYLLDEVTPEEKNIIEAWIREDAVNQSHFKQLASIWEESRKVATTSDVDVQVAWQRFRSRIDSNRSATGNLQKSQTVKFNWLRIAALVILVAGVGLITYNVIEKNQEIMNVTASSAGNILNETLPDGSLITLNKNSTLTYPQKFKGATRTVSLKGEAFFSVKPDKSKPFFISVNDVTIKVVGTSFNVRSEHGITEVIVETGVVQVTRNKKMVVLKAREKVVVNESDSLMQTVKEEEHLYNHYRTKEFVCDNTPLWKLVDVLNEAYQVHITIGRNSLRNLPLNATFSNESLDHILEIVGLTLNARVTRSGDQIILQ